MVFVGDKNPPKGSWADPIPTQKPTDWDGSKKFPQDWKPPPYTTIEKTPVIREKPYLICDPISGKYSVVVPSLRKNTIGASWTEPSGSNDKGGIIPLDQFFVAKAGTLAATASELNKRLSEGYHLLLTPGIYHLERSLIVDYQDTVILGIGMATLIPDYGTAAMLIADVDGVSISGIIFDAGPVRSSSLLVIGYNCALPGASHRERPTALFDCSARVGGEGRAVASNCFIINSNDVILDNVWLWRADHGRMGTHDSSVVSWDANPAENGLTVNGDRVVAYGLFVEHFQGYQTIWNGNDGQVFFYQSEIPYDVPNQDTWRWQWQPDRKGCASYKVSDQVSSHLAKGLGVYCNYWYPDIHLDNAIEVPDLSSGRKINIENMCTVWLNGIAGSSIDHVVGGKQSSGWAIKDRGASVLSTQTMGPSRVLKVEAIPTK